MRHTTPQEFQENPCAECDSPPGVWCEHDEGTPPDASERDLAARLADAERERDEAGRARKAAEQERVAWQAKYAEEIQIARADIARLAQENVERTMDLLREKRCNAATEAAVTAERDALIVRRDELLALAAKLTRDVPYEEEARSTATLIAEVGTLRAANAELASELVELRKRVMSVVQERVIQAAVEWRDAAPEEESVEGRAARITSGWHLRRAVDVAVEEMNASKENG